MENVPSIAELEALALEQVEVDLELVHTFSEGVYLRELHIPQGTLVVGKRHRDKTVNMLIKGKMTVYDGETAIVIQAPYIAESDKFTKKVGYAHEDSVWVNVHPTDITDLEEIERKVIVSEEEYEEIIYKENLCLGSS